MSTDNNIGQNSYSYEPYDSDAESGTTEEGLPTSNTAHPGSTYAGVEIGPTITYEDNNGSSTTLSVVSIPLSNKSTIDISIMVMALSTEGQEKGSKAAQVVIQIKQGEMNGLNAQAMAKIEEALAAQAKSGKSGELGKIFGWIGVAASILAAVVTMNPALMAVAVMAITMMSLQETGQMEKLAQEIGTEAFIALMVIIAIVMIAAPMAMPAGAGGAAATTAATVSQAEQSVILATIANNAARIQATMNAIDAASSVTSGAFYVESAQYQHESATASADSDRKLAQSDRAAAFVDQFLGFYVEMMSKYDSSKQSAYEIVSDTHETNKIIANGTT